MDELKLFKGLGDSTRLLIVKLLLGGEKCVCEIFPKVKRAQPTVSIQLAKLQRLGIISSRKEGKWVFYKIKDRRVESIIKLLK